MERGRRKTRVGYVVSDKMQKTVVVAVEWRQSHPLYGKSVKRVTKFHVHDEDDICKVGDRVNIMETRPLSKTKRWRVTQVLSSVDIPSSVELLELPEIEIESSNDGQNEDNGSQEKEE